MQIHATPREQLVLMALYKTELYGSQILQAILEASEGERSMTGGTLYPVLRILQKKGYILSRAESEEERQARGGGGGDRRYFKLTPMGEIEMLKTLAYWENLTQWNPH